MTKLDHDANISPWLEIAHDKGVVVQLAELDERVPDRPRPPALARHRADEGGRVPDGRRTRSGRSRRSKEIVEIAHEAGALAWVDAVHYAPHGDIEIPEIGCDVLLCSPYKFFGPHLGLAWVRRELSRAGGPTRCGRRSTRPGQRHETGTLAARAPLRVRRLRRVPARRRLEVHHRARAQARAEVPRRAARRLDAARAADDGGARADVLRLAAGRDAGGGRGPARRGRVRRLGRQLLRGRGLQAPRAARRRDPDRHRPHEHGGRGRPAARGAAAGSRWPTRTTPARRSRRSSARSRAPRCSSSSPRAAAELEARLPALKATLGPADGLWIAWPKKAAKLETDLDFDAVQAAGLAAGSSTTRAARSTRAGRRCASCTGSTDR